MKIPGQEVPDAEKALLEKTVKLKELLAEANKLVKDLNKVATKHKVEFALGWDNSLNSKKLDTAGNKVVTNLKKLVDYMGWSSSSIGC